MDFGDQIHRTLDAAARAASALLAALRARYRYILVDEFQDTNHAQLELVRLLAGDGPARTSPWSATTTRPSTAGAAPRPRTCSPSAGSTRGAREVVLTENHRSTQVILDAAGAAHLLQQPATGSEAMAGIDKRLRSAAAARAARAPPRTSTRVSAEADAVAAPDRRAARARLPAARRRASSCAATTTPTRSCARSTCKGIPHRFSGSRGLYAREEVRLLVSLPARAGEPRRLGARSSTSRASSSTACPRRDLHAPQPVRARARARPLLEVAARPARGTRSWPAIGGARARRRRACSPTSTRAAEDVPRPAHGRGAVPASCRPRASWPACRSEASAEARGAGQKHRALLRRR